MSKKSIYKIELKDKTFKGLIETLKEFSNKNFMFALHGDFDTMKTVGEFISLFPTIQFNIEENVALWVDEDFGMISLEDEDYIDSQIKEIYND